MELFDYFEVFYNQRQQVHRQVGQISPAAFERRANEEGVDPIENRPTKRFPTGFRCVVLIHLKNSSICHRGT